MSRVNPIVNHASAAPAADSGEMMACARLLATSVAHHRAKFGVIPLAASCLSEGPAAPGTPSELRSAAEATFEEALQLVRARLAQAAAAPPLPVLTDMSAADADADADDKRRQLRISVNAPAEIADADGQQPRPATMRNISWGGARVRCADMPGGVGDRVCLLLPYGRDGRIPIVSTILRLTQINGETEYGLRFESLTPADEARLQRVLEILVEQPPQDGRRSEARLVQRLDIEYGDAGEFRATLEDISASGLMLTVPEPLELNQSLLIALSSTDAPCGLNLRARVVHQSLVEDAGFEMYRVGLQFEHPSPELRASVAEMLRQLASLRPETAQAPTLECVEAATA